MGQSSPNAVRSSPPRATLVDEVVCPNCWERFPPERIHYVSAPGGPRGDLRLGPDRRQRFLPTRFDPEGRAIDVAGQPCHELACPRCHLKIPRMLVECPALFVSIFGTPSGGKSYFLASMCHRLRHVLPREFRINFSDADPAANASLHHYEDALFGGSEGGWVSLPKTDVTGDRYRIVDFGNGPVRYPRPFFFQVSPAAGHPLVDSTATASRVICLYDNAGESFEPGRDLPANPVTQHMARSGCLLFIFDPLQDVGFRNRLRTVGDGASAGSVTSRQEVMLAEVARRIRQYHRLPATARHDCPLIVVVSKFDAWQELVNAGRLPYPWSPRPGGGPHALRTDILQKASVATRDMLLKHAPTIVTTAESFVDPRLIFYVPVSATGGSPRKGSDGMLGFAAGSLNPMWAEVPMIQTLSHAIDGLILPG